MKKILLIPFLFLAINIAFSQSYIILQKDITINYKESDIILSKNEIYEYRALWQNGVYIVFYDKQIPIKEDDSLGICYKEIDISKKNFEKYLNHKKNSALISKVNINNNSFIKLINTTPKQYIYIKDISN